MKATGIVRRIDELGRIVIPKEIRRTLRIREGDPLEIYTDREGGIILKKYSPIGELAAFALDFAEALSSTLGLTTIISDRDTVLAASGEYKREYFERAVSSALEDSMNARTVIKKDGANTIPLVSGEDSSQTTSQLIAPISMDGQPIGAIVVVARGGAIIGDAEQKAAEAAAAFMGKQMEQ
ncbi:MAG: stage V sporulation T C-terminal domain-containing protein [Eubacteriales bacterium]|nr:stage V sporulation T C-terminal domain-containing protein [Eubacteriales bacterium]